MVFCSHNCAVFHSIRLLIFFLKINLSVTSGEAITLVNLMSFSKMEAETELP